MTQAELRLHQLRRAGFDPEWKCVENEEDFLHHLEPLPNIVLADYQLPEFDVLRALRLLQRRELDVPFIVVSDAIGEEVAVLVMQLGATDFLLKDRLFVHRDIPSGHLSSLLEFQHSAPRKR
ncbi:MAG: response regulator [Acidobacteria bacterium]|nr:response regulator [Acidobacteriota bacterium]